MPTSLKTLDLDAWALLIPEKRHGDHEYNLLLQRFQSFYNEVKEFYSSHNNCSTSDSKHYLNSSLSRASRLLTETSSFDKSGNEQRTNLSTTSDELVSFPSLSGTSQHKGQLVVNLKKKFSQDYVPNSPSFKGQSASRNDRVSQLRTVNSKSQDDSTQHSSSVHNLASIIVDGRGGNNVPGVMRPEQPKIKQRSQSGSNAQSLLSKSTERLDNLNNNHLPTGASLDHDIASQTQPVSTLPQRATLSRDSRYLQDNNTIYDAVTSDDHEVRNRLQSTPSNTILPSQRDAHRFDKNIEKSPPVPNSSRFNLHMNEKSFQSSPISNQKIIVDGHDDSDTPLQSSLIQDNTTSSLSLLTNEQDYGNYVNIDFFLKRSQSPSFDGLDDGSSDGSSDDDRSQMSTSLSTDRLCDESLKGLSPRELAKKLSRNDETNNSSSSLTPASSADFLDDTRATLGFQVSTTSSFKHFDGHDQYNSFFASNSGQSNDILNMQSRSSTTPRESTGSRLSITNHQKALGMILENQAVHDIQISGRDSNQLQSNYSALSEANTSMRSFLSDLNLSPVDDVFEDKAQRRIVKESFAVEFCGRRKLRHLFLFNDVIVCAKYQASSKQKFTFDVKWYLNLDGVTVSDVNDTTSQIKLDREAIDNQILAIRTNLMLLRSKMQQIKRSKDKRPSKIIKKLKKKRTEQEAELVLLLPHLPLVLKHFNGKRYLFFLSSNFDRSQWIESIKYLQSRLPISRSSSTPSSSELQAWIQTCRKNLNPSLGTFLLRSNCDDDLLYGDLHINLNAISGLPKPGHYYFCFEVDSYGHFSQKASSVVLSIDKSNLDLSEEYIVPLDGAHTLRILLYEDLGQNYKPSVIGKAHLELSRSWFLDKPIEKIVEFSSNCRAFVCLGYVNLEPLSMRIQHTKLCPNFGLDITQVCKKEKTNVPMLIQLCVNEVERRGMREVGIYRMSGTSTDVQRLKKAFETNPHVAELMLRDIDINSVTGFLKTYLREIPEGLFINKLYLKFVATFNIPQSNILERTKKMLDLFRKIPTTNQHTIMYLVEHLVKVNKFEVHNKMSLTNLATVLGPNILRPPTDNNADSSDPFTAVVIGSMSQAGILYFFLNRRASGLSFTDLDPSELDSLDGPKV